MNGQTIKDRALDARQQNIVMISALTATGDLEHLRTALNSGLERYAKSKISLSKKRQAPRALSKYLPKEKILFQADMLNPDANGSISIAQDTTVSFSEKLQQLGLQIDKIYGVHGRPRRRKSCERLLRNDAHLN